VPARFIYERWQQLLEMDRIRLTKIDKENWRFILYESVQKNWFVSFSYSPQSFVDLSMLIELTNDEKEKAKDNRQFLIDFSEKVRSNFKDYLARAKNTDDFVIVEEG
jgi:hypothetical protein